MDAQVPTAITYRSSRRLLSSLHSTDRLLIAFWALITIFCAGFRIQFWWAIAGANVLAICLTLALAYAAHAFSSKWLRWIHDWAAFPMTLYSYKQMYFIIGPLHGGKDYDQLLAALDRALLGVNPTQWLSRLSFPVVTEVLQIAYSLFYVLFVAIGLELYLRKNHSGFGQFRFTVVYGFLLSYIGYLFLPAVGPRFMLHDFSRINVELPGLLVTPALRWFVNIFESITPGLSNAAALSVAQRDVFPSGHTMMTLVAIVLAFRYRLVVRRSILPVGILLILATVYLRYHYVVDVAAGAFLAILCLATAEKAQAVSENPWRRLD